MNPVTSRWRSDVLDELVGGDRVRLRLLLRRREGAELALHAADVRLVHVQVLDEVDLVRPAAQPPREVGELAEREQVVRLEEREPVLEVEPLSGLDLLADRLQRVRRDDGASAAPLHDGPWSSASSSRAVRRRRGTPSPSKRSRAPARRDRSSAPVAATRTSAPSSGPPASASRTTVVLAGGEEERQRRRPVAQVGARHLPGLDRLAGAVEDVVGDLERDPEREPERAECARRASRARTRPRRASPSSARSARGTPSIGRVGVVRWRRCIASPRASARQAPRRGSSTPLEVARRQRARRRRARRGSRRPLARRRRRARARPTRARAGAPRRRSGRRGRASPCARARRRRRRDAAAPLRAAPERNEQRPQPLAARGERARAHAPRRAPGSARPPPRAAARARPGSAAPRLRGPSRARSLPRTAVCSATLPPPSRPVADLGEAGRARGARTGPRARGSGARSQGGTCTPSRPGSTLPASGTSTSNQSRKNGRRSPRGRVISSTASLPARPEDARSSRSPPSRSVEVADAEPDGRRVELAVPERQRERVAPHPLDRPRLAARPLEHALGEVEPDDPPAAPLRLDREVAGAAAGVEHAIAGPDDLATAEPPPAPVEPGRHHPVHHVVDRGDPVEHPADLVGGRGVPPRSVTCAPPLREHVVDAELVETARDEEVDEVVDRLRRRGRSPARRRGSPRPRRSASRARAGGSRRAESRAGRARASAAP